jgi:hypothetical protein
VTGKCIVLLVIDIYFVVNLKRFEVNLANSRGDIVLHVNPRLNDRQVVLNSAPGGGWGGEERKPLNISRGQPFSLIIMVTEQGFKVRFRSENNTIIFYYLIIF